jgi:hypothetical protein
MSHRNMKDLDNLRLPWQINKWNTQAYHYSRRL